MQDLLMPGLAFGAPAEMYARLNAQVTPRLAQRALVFRPGGVAAFDTYFSSVSVGVYKRATVIHALALTLQGQGRFLLRVGLRRLGHTQSWLAEHEVTLPLQTPLALPWVEVDDGLLYIALEALEDGELTSGAFVTPTAPVSAVRLGVVITHFNRQAFVLPAIARMRADLLERPEDEGAIELIVVDNSRNLGAEPAPHVTVLPNANFGGAGGFARGLLHLVDSGRFTHCLFMDDDASCEIDAIRRAFVLQRYARAPNLAVAGALLREMEPYRLFEKGGLYRHNQLAPRHSLSDVRGTDTLMKIEQDDTRTDYGAWWFFGFRLDQVTAYPFPFFVRGDDALFSLLNDFHIETLNGIACWGEDFQLKENPTTRYLGMRSTLAILLMTASSGRLPVFKLMLGWFMVSLLSYNYASVEAICMAIEDTAKGPEFWRQNLDMTHVRAALAPLNAREKLQPLRLAEHDWVAKPLTEGRLRRLLRLATLNGFLLPSLFIRDILVRDKKGFRATLRVLFRARRVIYVYEPLSTGYIATHDKRAALAVTLRFLRAARHFITRLRPLEATYKAALPEMTSEEFWRDMYQTKPDA